MKKHARLIMKEAQKLGLHLVPLNKPGHLHFDVYDGKRCIGSLVTANTPNNAFGTVCAATRDLKRLKHQGAQHAIPESGGQERPERRSLA